MPCISPIAFWNLVPFVRSTRCSLPTLLSRPLHILQVDAFFRHLVERRKLTQTLNGFDDAISNIVHLGFGIEAADAEANRTVRQVVTRAQSLQYIRWLKRRRGACRTAGNGDVVDPHQQRLTFHVREANVQVAGQAMLHRSVDVGLIQTVHDAVAQAKRQDSCGISSCAIAQALPRPTIPGTFKVPERMPRSWPPPSMRAESWTRGFLRRTYKAPTPLGPYILWPEIHIIPMFCLFTSVGTLPTACVASVWKITPRSRQSLPSSVTGCSTPISLLAAIIVTRIVLSSVARFRSSRSIRPFFCTGM